MGHWMDSRCHPRIAVFNCKSNRTSAVKEHLAKFDLVRFLGNYASFLPGIFSSDMPFMSYHAQSPFLFWTMACTGARRFHDVGYFQRAASKVRELVTASLLQIQDPIATIQAILILCLWPQPVDTMWKDPSHVMAGAAMQLAVQSGFTSSGMSRTSEELKSIATTKIWQYFVFIFGFIA
jgi:transcriptional regulatory protein LEU3